jgi:hypothetical protein
MKNMNFIVATCILKINQYGVDCKRAIHITIQQLVAEGEVITSLYSLSRRRSEYRLVITESEAKNKMFSRFALSLRRKTKGFPVLLQTSKSTVPVNIKKATKFFNSV